VEDEAEVEDEDDVEEEVRVTVSQAPSSSFRPQGRHGITLSIAGC